MIKLGGVPVRDSGRQMLNVMREVEAAGHIGSTPATENPANSISVDLQILELIAGEPFDAEFTLERLVRGAHQN
ncbi:hypothetical protein AB0P45_27250 [Streptomyces niveus]|uniref:hypothetical protein n=1 Tax=Streptomyces niveus TaxID=193462 RepID=UPI00343FE097